MPVGPVEPPVPLVEPPVPLVEPPAPVATVVPPAPPVVRRRRSFRYRPCPGRRPTRGVAAGAGGGRWPASLAAGHAGRPGLSARSASSPSRTGRRPWQRCELEQAAANRLKRANARLGFIMVVPVGLTCVWGEKRTRILTKN